MSIGRATSAARVGLYTLCLALALSADGRHVSALVASFLGLGLLGLASSVTGLSPIGKRLVPFLEAVVWAAGVLETGGNSSALLPYLLAPAFAGGIGLGLEGVLLTIGSAAVSLVVWIPTLDHPERFRDVGGAAGEWIALGLIVGLLGSWVGGLQRREPDPDNYLAAYRLLGQLRAIARRLPAGLDRLAVADGLLREVRSALPEASGGTVLVRGHGYRLTHLTSSGRTFSRAPVDVTDDSVFGDAWTTQQPTIHDNTVVLPLVAGERTSGLLVLTLDRPGVLKPEDLAAAVLAAREGALRLETALLFDELREEATVEERRRLAREIHDGVAQDLAAFGYQLDALAHDARKSLTQDQVAEQLGLIRSELGGLVTELRHSIFELRTDVDQHGSLGAALAEYARAVSRGSSLAVHLTLDERPERLAADTEAELLRIAQEAITNTRRHSKAENLWIRCEVDPPEALLVVEDDGVGVGGERVDSFGLEIMRERADRLRAVLTVQPRDPHGTIITCKLGQR